MENGILPDESAESSSQNRLIRAVLELWETQGNAGISARMLGQAAGLPVSSIYYHFGGLEQLLLCAQETAQAMAARWCDAHLEELPDAADLSPEALPGLLAALIDDWAHAHRRLAFAWRECQIVAARDPRYLPAMHGWQAIWTAFWEQICARCGLPGAARMTGNFFDGESLLHFARWRRAVDRACLDEVCRGWGIWLTEGRLVPEGPWRRFARTEALRSRPESIPRGDVAERIAHAAAATVEELGVAGLTHRAVAARADLTLGVVSYNYRTSADLLRVAFETIYRLVVPVSVEEGLVVPPGDSTQVIEEMARVQLAGGYRLAIDELLIAVARDPGLRPFAAQLRYLRGRTSVAYLRALVGGARDVSPLDAALLSDFSMGQGRACVGLDPEAAHAYIRQGLGELLAVLEKGADLARSS